MMSFFKQKCPVCRTKLEDGGKYPEMDGKKFHSEECKEKYKKEIDKQQSSSSGCCCH